MDGFDLNLRGWLICTPLISRKVKKNLALKKFYGNKLNVW